MWSGVRQERKSLPLGQVARGDDQVITSVQSRYLAQVEPLRKGDHAGVYCLKPSVA